MFAGSPFSAMGRHLYAMLVFVALAACGMPVTPDAFRQTPEAQFLNSIVDRVASRDFDSIEAQLHPSVSPQEARVALQKVADALPQEPITKVEAAGWTQTFNSGDAPTVVLAAQYTFGDSFWLVASAQLVGRPNEYRIAGFNMRIMGAPLEKINAFTLAGKGVGQYLFLVAAVAAFAVSVLALVRCARTRGLRRKWLWLVFIAVGFVAFSMNWTTGVAEMRPLSINLMSAAVVRDGWLGSWTVTFSVPLGAIWFLIRHRNKGRGPSQDTATPG